MDATRVCGKCNGSDLISHMVGCDMCDVWFHQSCAGIDAGEHNPNKSWRCEKCIHDEATEAISQTSRNTTRSTSIRTKRIELELKQLEEKHVLIQKLRAEEDELRRKRAEEDTQLLDQKFQLLQAAEEENRSNRSGISSTTSREKVMSWLEPETDGEKQGNIDLKSTVPPSCMTVDQTPLAVL